MDSADIITRPAVLADAQKLARLHYLSHTRSFQEFASPEWIEVRNIQDYQDFWIVFLQDLSGQELTWTIWNQEQLLGTVSLKELKNSSAIFRPSVLNGMSDSRVCCLRLMYVDPGLIRKGLGGELMELAGSFMRGEGYLLGSLITHAANRRARLFYESQGWQLDEIFREQVKEFFEEPESMRKRARYLIDLTLTDVGKSTVDGTKQGLENE